MKKPLFFFLFYISISQFLFGQNPLVKQWDYRFGGFQDDYVVSFQQTIDLGYILGGGSLSGMGGDKSQFSRGYYDYWIVKIDSIGNKIWDKRFGGTDSEFVGAMEQTTDGGYIIGGQSFSGIGADKSQINCGTGDYWIVKIDSVGNKQWDKTFGGPNNDALISLKQCLDGGYILGGRSNSNIGCDKTQVNLGGYDYWIIKTDSLGIKQWDKNFGGTSDDTYCYLQLTKDGGYILGGYSNSGIGGDKTQMVIGSNDYWIIKIDSLGNKLWDMDFGGSNDDYLNIIINTNDQGFIIGGISNSIVSGQKSQPTWGYYDYWIIKIDSIGNFKWDRDYGGTDGEVALGNISLTNDEGFLISGISYSNISGDKSENNLSPEQTWILKIDSIGNKIWDKTLHTNATIDDEIGLSLQTNDGSYAFANFTNGSIGGDKTQNCRGGWDFWVSKYRDTTLVKPIINLSSSDTTFCDKQYIDFYDQSTNYPTSWQWLFPGGNPSSSMQQNPTGIFYNSYGSFDVTLIACNSAGCDTLFLPNFINEFPNPLSPTITWIADTLFSSPAYSYQWYDASGIIPGATGQYYVFQQPGNYYVVVTDSNGCASSSFVIYTGIDEVASDMGVISIVPNPSDGNFILYGAPIQSTLKIYDIAGRVIYSDRIENSPEHLQLKASDGIYFLEIISDNTIQRNKIVLKRSALN